MRRTVGLEARIAALPCWNGKVTLEPLQGGVSNRCVVTKRASNAPERRTGLLRRKRHAKHAKSAWNQALPIFGKNRLIDANSFCVSARAVQFRHCARRARAACTLCAATRCAALRGRCSRRNFLCVSDAAGVAGRQVVRSLRLALAADVRRGRQCLRHVGAVPRTGVARSLRGRSDDRPVVYFLCGVVADPGGHLGESARTRP